MPGHDADVLVVGAGPVGLTMAAGLRRHGLTCRLIDKAPAPSDKSKALVVWSRTLELLDRLDLAETFIAAGMKIRGASMYSSGQRLVHIEIAGADSPYAFPLMIPQNETERLLTEDLARHGLAIERQVELVTFREEGDQVVSTLRHPDGREETLATPWLVGCDGAHSTVRHTLGMPFTGHAEPNDWMLADVRVAGPLAWDEVSIFWHERGVLAFFPINRERFRMVADIGAASAEAPPPAPTLADAQAMVDERGPGGLTFSDPIWLANFRINERKVSDYRRGRILLAGDAAHIHSPAGGQGMNTGMQDAFNLAWKLALAHRGQGRVDPLLDSYSVERSAIGDQVLQAAGRLTSLATLRSPVAQFLRNHLAPVITSFGFVQDNIRNAMCELSINYRHGPLAAEDWPWHAAGEIRPGDRLPDAPLTDPASGQQTTAFAALRGPRHALLVFPGTNGRSPADGRIFESLPALETSFPGILAPLVILPAGHSTPSGDPPRRQGETPALVDAENRLHAHLGVTAPSMAVIRPDGYLAYRCQPADGEKVCRFLERYLVRSR